jgi:hypothetical protein
VEQVKQVQEFTHKGQANGEGLKYFWGMEGKADGSRQALGRASDNNI